MEPVNFDDPIEHRKWVAKLVASAKGHAPRANRPFELTGIHRELDAQQIARV